MNIRTVFLLAFLGCGLPLADAQQRQPAQRDRPPDRVYKACIQPHWFQALLNNCGSV